MNEVKLTTTGLLMGVVLLFGAVFVFAGVHLVDSPTALWYPQARNFSLGGGAAVVVSLVYFMVKVFGDSHDV